MEMASIRFEAIESGKIRISDDATLGLSENGFNHANPTDWLHKRAANDYVNLLRKCE